MQKEMAVAFEIETVELNILENIQHELLWEHSLWDEMQMPLHAFILNCNMEKEGWGHANVGKDIYSRLV